MPDVSLRIVLALTLSTGAVDAVSYFSLDHVFTANMSGNIALLGIGLATDVAPVAGNAFAFAGFVLGSIAIARWFRRRAGGSPARVAFEALALELLLLATVTAIVAGVDTTRDAGWRYCVCLLLAAAMGMQTGLSRHLAVKDVNTTVATMTLHDLAAASRLAGGDSTRWRRRAAVVLALLAGAALGVTLDGVVRWGGLAFTCATVAAVMVMAFAAERRHERAVFD